MLERSERRWLWIFALLVVLLTTFPYVLAYSVQGAGWHFTGFLFAMEDSNSYIAKMLSGSTGNWLFRTPYTAYPQKGVLLFPFYILLGKLAAPPGLHEQLVALYHLARVTGVTLVVFATYDLAALFLDEPRSRRWATVLAALGGGLGWLIVFGLSRLWRLGLPLEYYSPETFGFLGLFGLPHLAIARAFFLWALRDYLLARDNLRSARSWLRTSLLWLGVLITQPMTAAVGWAVVGLHLLSSGVWLVYLVRRGGVPDWGLWKRYLAGAVRMLVVTLPVMLYTLLSFRLDPYLSTWESQSILPAPPFVEYLLAYAILLPLAAWGAWPLLRERPWTALFLVGWVIAFPALAYAPFSSQRRLLEGVWVALAILASSGLARIPFPARRLAYGWTALAFLSTLFLLIGGTMAASKPALPLFRPADEVHIFQYLAAKAPPHTVVLASYNTSNPLPAWTAVRTLVGLGTESANGPLMLKRVDCFYQAASCSDTDRLALLDQFRVSYIMYGPYERSQGDWNPAKAPYLSLVDEQGAYQLYQYPRSSGAQP